MEKFFCYKNFVRIILEDQSTCRKMCLNYSMYKKFIEFLALHIHENILTKSSGFTSQFCVHVCVCVCVYICMYVCMHVCICYRSSCILQCHGPTGLSPSAHPWGTHCGGSPSVARIHPPADRGNEKGRSHWLLGNGNADSYFEIICFFFFLTNMKIHVPITFKYMARMTLAVA